MSLTKCVLRGASAIALGVGLAIARPQQTLAEEPMPPTLQADGSTPLLWAAYRGDAAEVSALIRSGADVRAANRYGATPMSEAAERGDTQVLQLLLKAGADPESPNSEGQTALMAVARTGNVEAARLLVAHGAKVDAREQWGGQTALMWAAAQSQPTMIHFLLSKGANPNARAAVRDWQRRVTAEGRPKNMNRGGFTPLLFAAREGCVDCVKELLKGKADVNLPDPDSTTPLALALLNGHWDTAKVLIDMGADVDQWDFWGRTPLYNAVDMNILPAGAHIELPGLDTNTGVDIIKLLLEKGANPNAQLKLRPPYRQGVFDRGADPALITGATPLMRAAVAADIRAIALLLSHKALVDLPNEEGVTPFMAAVSAAGTRGKNKTEAQANDALKLLHDAGADVNAGGHRGVTAAHSAAFRGWNSTLKLLASYGANLDAVEADRLTPIDYAMGRSRVGFLQTKPPVRADTSALLRELGAKVENPSLPPWPGVPTPTLTASVPE